MPPGLVKAREPGYKEYKLPWVRLWAAGVYCWKQALQTVRVCRMAAPGSQLAERGSQSAPSESDWPGQSALPVSGPGSKLAVDLWSVQRSVERPAQLLQSRWCSLSGSG